jgi:hypothetical protein
MNRLRLLVLVVALGAAGLALPQQVLAATQAGSVAQSGSLRLCKVAGAGITSAAGFTFNVTTQTVTRSLSISAGSCATLVVGTRADAQTQGYFANHASAATALLGSGVTLKVDSAQLTAGQVQAILTATSGKSGGVTFSSNALLTLVQQLLAADLNILRGRVATAGVLAALAQANSGINISVNGGSIALTSPLTTTQLSSLIDALTALNESRVGGAGNGTASVDIVESGVANTEVSAISCTPAAACSNVDLNGRSVTAVVSTGATTEVRITNRSTVGALKLCKIAGTGVTAGTSFTFTISGTTSRTVTIAAGSCELVQTIPEGSIQVTETPPSGVAVSAIACNPGCDQIDVNNATAQLTIAGGATSEVDVTNTGTVGKITVCKNAGTGIATGAEFTFTVTIGNGTPFDIQVTAGGLCTTVKNVPDGVDVTVSERASTAYRIFSIGCNPGCKSIDLGAGSVVITAAANTEKFVTFTNETNLGSIRLCKNAGTGIATGTQFTFTVTVGNQAPFDVDVTAGGLCETIDDVVDGTNVHITEKASTAYKIFSIACNPGCVNIDLGGGSVDIKATAATQKSVTFTNQTNLGSIRLCKNAGTGIATGTPFTFTVTVGSDVPFDVDVTAGGTCETIDNVVDGTNVHIAEQPSSAYKIFSIACNPGCVNIDLAGGSVDITATAATQKTVTVTNQATGALRVGSLRLPGL